jgi:hypothetical protein
VRAILIDVKNQVIKEVEHDDTLDNIYELVDCRLFDVCSIDSVNSIFLDDEGLLRNDVRMFDYFTKDLKYRIAGNGLILGLDVETGESISTTLNLDEVKNNVRFV